MYVRREFFFFSQVRDQVNKGYTVLSKIKLSSTTCNQDYYCNTGMNQSIFPLTMTFSIVFYAAKF